MPGLYEVSQPSVGGQAMKRPAFRYKERDDHDDETIATKPWGRCCGKESEGRSGRLQRRRHLPRYIPSDRVGP